MADITMCAGLDCPMRENCQRYLAEPDDYAQSWFSFLPLNKDNGTCPEFLEPQK